MKADRWFHSCTGVVFLVTVLAGSHWFVMAGRGAAGRVIDRGIFVLELGTASQSLPSLLSGGGGQFFEEASSVIKVEGERYPATPRKADRPLEIDGLLRRSGVFLSARDKTAHVAKKGHSETGSWPLSLEVLHRVAL